MTWDRFATGDINGLSIRKSERFLKQFKAKCVDNVDNVDHSPKFRNQENWSFYKTIILTYWKLKNLYNIPYSHLTYDKFFVNVGHLFP